MLPNPSNFAYQTSLSNFPKGANHFAAGQTTLSTTAALAVPANYARRSVLVKNTDAAIVIYLGASLSVSATNGLPLKAGESLAVDTLAAVYAIAASGSPVVAYLETAD